MIIIVILNIYCYNIYVVRSSEMKSNVADTITSEIANRKLKSITRSIRFEKKDWEELNALSVKYDLPIAHLVRKATKNYLKHSY